MSDRDAVGENDPLKGKDSIKFWSYLIGQNKLCCLSTEIIK